MKKISKNLLLITGTMLLFISSCTKDDDSTADPRDRFTGNWTHVEQSANFGTTTYTISISKSNSDNTNIIVKNFYQLGTSTSAIVAVSDNNLTVGQQLVSGQNIHGSGALTNSKINWTYYTDDGANKDTCTATSTKQ